MRIFFVFIFRLKINEKILPDFVKKNIFFYDVFFGDVKKNDYMSEFALCLRNFPGNHFFYLNKILYLWIILFFQKPLTRQHQSNQSWYDGVNKTERSFNN